MMLWLTLAGGGFALFFLFTLIFDDYADLEDSFGAGCFGAVLGTLIFGGITLFSGVSDFEPKDTQETPAQVVGSSGEESTSVVQASISDKTASKHDFGSADFGNMDFGEKDPDCCH